jgi:hypothetical protein
MFADAGKNTFGVPERFRKEGLKRSGGMIRSAFGTGGVRGGVCSCVAACGMFVLRYIPASSSGKRSGGMFVSPLTGWGRNCCLSIRVLNSNAFFAYYAYLAPQKSINHDIR